MSLNIFRLGEHFVANTMKLASYNLGMPLAVGATLQAGVIHFQRTDSRVARESNKINTLILTFNCIGTLYAAGKLARALQDRFDVSLVSPRMLSQNWTTPDWSYGRIFSFNLLSTLAGGVAIYALHQFTQECSSKLKPSGEIIARGTSITWEAPAMQRISETLNVTQMIAHLALLVIGSNRLQSLLSFAGAGASLYSSTKMEWIKLSNRCGGHAVTLRFRTLLIPDAHQEQNAGTCSEGHTQNREALKLRLVEEFNTLATFASDHGHYRTTRYVDDHGRVSYSYTLQLRHTQLPKCHNEVCNERPAHGNLWSDFVSIEYQGAALGPKSDFGASLYLAFGAIQLSLVLAQKKYPHLAGSIYKAQKVMAALDVLAIAGKIYDFQDIHFEEWGSEIVLSAIAVSAIDLAYIAYVHWTDIGENLVDRLKGAIPETDLENLTINQIPPISFRIMQWMLINKALLDLSLAPNADSSHMHLAAAAVEGAALYYLTQFEWINFERKMPMPLMGRKFQLFDRNFQEASEAMRMGYEKTLIEATPKFQMIITNRDALLSTPEAWQKTLQGIYDYSTKLFEDSFLREHVVVNRNRYGMEMSRKRFVTAQIIPRSLTIGNIDYSKLICSWGGKAFNRFKGNATLILQKQ